MNGKLKGLLLVSTTVLFWGFLPIALKVGLNHLGANNIVFARFGISAFALIAFYTLANGSAIKLLLKPPPLLILAGVSLAGNYFGFMQGLKYTTPANAQIFIQLGPIGLALLGFVVFKEAVTWQRIVGFLLAGAGMALFYFEQLSFMLGQEAIFNKGFLWIVFGAVTWIVYAVCQKRLVAKYPAQQLNMVIYTIALVCFVPLAEFKEFMGLSANGWLLVLFLGMNTLIAYGCLGESFKHLEANVISIIITFTPMLTFVAMALFTKFRATWVAPQQFSAPTVLGLVLVLAGAVLAVNKQR